jgi:hypothetical protein
VAPGGLPTPWTLGMTRALPWTETMIMVMILVLFVSGHGDYCSGTATCNASGLSSATSCAAAAHATHAHKIAWLYIALAGDSCGSNHSALCNCIAGDCVA